MIEKRKKGMHDDIRWCRNVTREKSRDLERAGQRRGVGIPLPKQHSIVCPVLKDVTYFSSLCWLF